MRLTLHTLLAYLDGVLPPDQMEAMKDRVEGTENARKLIEHLREVIAQPRLSAPRVDGKGIDGDPNLVAAYLDSSLPGEQVVELEKLCIESDRHLAEVGAVHRILADLVTLEKNPDDRAAWGERRDDIEQTAALLTDQLRATIHALPGSDLTKSRFAPKAAPTNGVKKEAVVNGLEPAEPPVVEPASPPRVDRYQVPDYLKEPKRSAWPAIVAGFAVVAALGGALWIWQGLQATRAPIAKIDDETTPPLPPEKVPEETSESTDAAKANLTSDQSSDTVAPVDATDTEPDGESTETAVGPAAPEVVESSEEESDPAPDAPSEEMEDPEGVAAAPVETDPESSELSPPVEDAGKTETRPPPSGGELGRLSPGKQALVRYDRAKNEWMRVAGARSVLVDDDWLAAPPLFRPQLSFRSGVQATVVGPAMLRVSADGDENVAMEIEQGRLFVFGAGMQERHIRLKMNGVEGTLTLIEPASDAAIELRGWFPPGADPIEDPSSLVVVATVFAVHGPVRWTQGEDVADVAPGNVRVIAKGGGFDSMETSGPWAPPDWIEESRETPLDRNAAAYVEPLLTPDRTFLRGVDELPMRRVEIQAFASRTKALFGDYRDLIVGLNGDNLKQAFWKQDVEMLRAEFARSPERAQRVRDSLEQHAAGRSDRLLRLLRGYSPAQLGSSAEVAELIDDLSNPDRDIRALAIDNLHRITGTFLNYNPAESTDRNRAPIEMWKKRKNDDKIEYKSAPTPFPEFKPAK